mmetsp:Transcript_49799/g.111976  ORF Transcript_49799/g.111976 Transcript_49799/m.111976 type:complete len:205 (+) Transcript_49799:452-1066(+)
MPTWMVKVLGLHFSPHESRGLTLLVDATGERRHKWPVLVVVKRLHVGHGQGKLMRQRAGRVVDVGAAAMRSVWQRHPKERQQNLHLMSCKGRPIHPFKVRISHHVQPITPIDDDISCRQSRFQEAPLHFVWILSLAAANVDSRRECATGIVVMAPRYSILAEAALEKASILLHFLPGNGRALQVERACMCMQIACERHKELHLR